MPTDIRFEFAQCVRNLGGLPLDDVLTGRSNNPKNADFVFTEDDVIAELKCLEADKEPAFISNAKTLIEDWIRRGKISQTSEVSLEELPNPLQREVLKPLRNYLKTQVIGEANKQIKQTKAEHGLPNAKGLLLIANEGNFALTPDMMRYLTGSILQSDDFSAIHTVVYFTVDLKVEGTPIGIASVWIPWSRERSGKQPVSVAFLERLRGAWMAHASVFQGEPVHEFQTSALRSLKFQRP